MEYVRGDAARLTRVAYLLVGNDADAQDLVQLCLLRVARRWNRIDTSPHAYARQVLARLATDRWRARRFRPADVPLDAAHHLPAADAFGASDLRHTLLGGLRLLPTRQRAVLVLRYFEQLSEAETAEALGLSAGTVKTHTARGLDRLRRLLLHASEGTTP
ncbi:MAG TPA: SigE family RNA polymerase sigma factor [Mycobacteriales bacterium]|nr:SigE family RNA polymerase sigma factor [Mycobacteriales bacterium]